VHQALNKGKSQSKGESKGATKYPQDGGKSSAEEVAALNFKKEIAKLQATEKTMTDLGWKDSQLFELREKIKEIKLAANGGVEQTREELAAVMLQKRIHLFTLKKKLKSQIREKSVTLREQYAQLQKAAENLDGITQELKDMGWHSNDTPSEDEDLDELQEMLERQQWQGAERVKGKGKGKDPDTPDWNFEEDVHGWPNGWQRDVEMAQEEHNDPVDWPAQAEEGAEDY
jgi:hypothetical protein